jgi:hypothetical protein
LIKAFNAALFNCLASVMETCRIFLPSPVK